MFIACDSQNDSSPQRGDMFRGDMVTKEGLKQTAAFVGAGCEELLLTEATAMNMSPAGMKGPGEDRRL
jgi:hypothetical protein